MLTRSQAQAVIEDYRRAMRLVNEASNTLIDVSEGTPALAEITGHHGLSAPDTLISTAGDLSGGLMRAIILLTEAIPAE